MDLNNESSQDDSYRSTFLSNVSSKKILLLLIIPILTLFILLPFILLLYRDNTPKQIEGATYVNPRSAYLNPFDKKTQYTNPFSEYKNPIINTK